MRLRSQLLLSAIATSLLCGVIGTLLLGRTVSQSAVPLLDSALRVGEKGISQQWRLRRSQRQASYDAVSQQPHFRAYLSSGDRLQLEYFAQLTRRQGADVAVIVDRSGTVVASDGPAADLIASRAAQGRFGPSGELAAVGGGLLDVFRLAVGSPDSEAPAGFLIAANRVTAESLRLDIDALRSDGDPQVIFAAVAVGDTWISTLPRELQLTGRLFDEPQNPELGRLAERYRLRRSVLGQAHFIVAIELTHIHAFSADFIRQLAGVLLIIMVATAGVALIVLGRITGPIENLKEAADLLGRGQLLRTRSLLQDFSGRTDEIGSLAQAFNIAAQRLNTFVAASQRLVRHLNTAVNSVERSAGAVASGAAQQEARLEEVTATLGPMTMALEQTSLGLADARNGAMTLSLTTSAADQTLSLSTAAVRRTEALLSSNENPEPRSYRTASLLQQISGMSKLNTDQREAFARVRDQVTALKRLLDDAVESQIREQHQGLFVQRATADIGRLAKQHNSEALALRVASEQLRRDMEHLHKLLSAIDAQGQIEFDETAAASSGYYRPIARATSEGEKREGGTSGSSERNAPLRRSGGHKRSGDGPAGSISRPSLPAVAPSGVSARGEDRPAASDRTARPDGRGTGSSPPQAERKQSASDRSTRSELKSLLSTPPGSDGRNPPNKS